MVRMHCTGLQRHDTNNSIYTTGRNSMTISSLATKKRHRTYQLNPPFQKLKSDKTTLDFVGKGSRGILVRVGCERGKAEEPSPSPSRNSRGCTTRAPSPQMVHGIHADLVELQEWRRRRKPTPPDTPKNCLPIIVKEKKGDGRVLVTLLRENAREHDEPVQSPTLKGRRGNFVPYQRIAETEGIRLYIPEKYLRIANGWESLSPPSWDDESVAFIGTKESRSSLVVLDFRLHEATDRTCQLNPPLHEIRVGWNDFILRVKI